MSRKTNQTNLQDRKRMEKFGFKRREQVTFATIWKKRKLIFYVS